MTLDGATIEFFDHSVRNPALALRIEKLDAEAGPFSLPALDRSIDVQIDGVFKGPQRDGRIAIEGAFTPMTRDADLRARFAGVDLVPLQHYLLKGSDTAIRHGVLDLDLRAKVARGRLNAPGKLTLTNLELVDEGPLGDLRRRAAQGRARRDDGARSARSEVHAGRPAGGSVVLTQREPGDEGRGRRCREPRCQPVRRGEGPGRPGEGPPRPLNAQNRIDGRPHAGHAPVGRALEHRFRAMMVAISIVLICRAPPCAPMLTAFYTHPDCRLHDMGDGHPECPQRIDAITDHLRAIGLDIALDMHHAPAVAMSDVELAHSVAYVRELREFTQQVEAADRPRNIDPDTVVCPATWRAALRAAGAAVAATDDVIDGRAANAFCAVRPRATMPRATRPWASASSTTWRSPRAMRSTCAGWSAWRSSTSTSTTGTAPRTSSPATSAC